MRSPRLLPPTLLVAFVWLSTCGAAYAFAGIAGSAAEARGTAPQAAGQAVRDAGRTGSVDAAVRAVQTARRTVTGGVPYDLERERLRGVRGWSVKVAAGRQRPYEIFVRADGRRVLQRTREEHFEDDAARALRARVGLGKALRVAARHLRGRLSEADLDRVRGGAIVWTVTFERGGREREAIVNATSGAYEGARSHGDDGDDDDHHEGDDD